MWIFSTGLRKCQALGKFKNAMQSQVSQKAAKIAAARRGAMPLEKSREIVRR